MTEHTPDAGRRSGWFKSSFSASNGHCVEVRFESAVIGVRDSKKPDGARLAFGRTGWVRFLAELTDGM